MSRGSATLAQLNSRIERLQSNVSAMDRELEVLGSKHNTLRQQQANTYSALAALRLDDIRAGEISGTLNRVEREAQALLQQREVALDELLKRISAAQARLVEANALRDENVHALEMADAALSEQVDQSDQALEADGHAMKVRDGANKAIERAEAGNEKARQAREDREQKGKPYEDDPLFMYLWKRKYGLSEYRAGNLTRMLDGWVARLVDYHNARPNYAMLLEIPERLAEHAEHLKTQAEEQVAQFEALRSERYAADGVEGLEALLNEARGALAATDERLADQEKLVASLNQERATYADGADHYTQKAMGLLVHELREARLPDLIQRAAATPDPKDDELTRQLSGIDSRIAKLSEQLDRQRVEHQVVQDRLGDLDGLRRKFRRKSYADPHSHIRSSSKIDGALERFLIGALSAAQLWQIIEKQQYFKRTKTRHNWPGGWGGGSSGGGWSGGSSGGGGFGGGGFSSGGSFGGGGFKTGGGF